MLLLVDVDGWEVLMVCGCERASLRCARQRGAERMTLDASTEALLFHPSLTRSHNQPTNQRTSLSVRSRRRVLFEVMADTDLTSTSSTDTEPRLPLAPAPRSVPGVSVGPRPRVWLDGCFDCFHYGHANAIRQVLDLARVVSSPNSIFIPLSLSLLSIGQACWSHSRGRYPFGRGDHALQGPPCHDARRAVRRVMLGCWERSTHLHASVSQSGRRRSMQMGR